MNDLTDPAIDRLMIRNGGVEDASAVRLDAVEILALPIPREDPA